MFSTARAIGHPLIWNPEKGLVFSQKVDEISQSELHQVFSNFCVACEAKRHIGITFSVVRLSHFPMSHFPKLCFAGNTCIPRNAATIFMPPAWKVRRGHLVIGLPVRLSVRNSVPLTNKVQYSGFPQSLKCPWILGFPWKVLENEFVLEKSLKLGDLPWNFNR